MSRQQSSAQHPTYGGGRRHSLVLDDYSSQSNSEGSSPTQYYDPISSSEEEEQLPTLTSRSYSSLVQPLYDSQLAVRVEQLEREKAEDRRQIASLVDAVHQLAYRVVSSDARAEDANNRAAAVAESAVQTMSQFINNNLSQERRSPTSASRGRSTTSRRSIQDAYDMTNPTATLPLRVAELAEESYPLIYKTHRGKRDYDPSRWTWSTRDNEPYYVRPDARARDLFDRKVAVTEPVADIYDSPDFAIRFNNPSHDTYNQTRPDTVMNTVMKDLGKQRDRSDKPEEVTLYNQRKTVLEQKMLAQTLNQHVSRFEDIPIVIGNTPSAQALPVAQYKQLYPHDSLVATVRDKEVYFDGLLTVNEMEINTKIYTLDQFEEVVTNTLAKIAAFDLPVEGTVPPIVYWLQAYYTATDPLTKKQLGETKVGFWKGLTTDIDRMKVELSTDLPKTLEDLGYDAVRETGSYQIDMSRFVIKRIDLTRSGSGKGKTHTYQETMKKLLTDRRIQSFHDFGGIYQLAWATIYGVKSTSKNGCFPRALAHHLKKAGMREKARKTAEGNTIPAYSVHDARRESALLRKHYGTEIPWYTACNIASTFGLHCTIYALDGSVLAHTTSKNTPVPYPVNEEDRTLKLMLADSHYVNVIALKQQPDAAEDIDSKVEKSVSGCNPVIGYYDIETVNDAQAHVVPYANAYKIDGMTETLVSITTNPGRHVFEPMLQAIAEKGSGHHHYLCAYNGCNFDHIQLFRYLLEKGVKVVSAPNPKGKGQSFTVMLKATKSDDWVSEEIRRRVSALPALSRRADKKEQFKRTKLIEAIHKAVKSGVCYVSTWDPVMFVRMSLAQAARSFKLELSKGVLDHTEVQAAYAQGKLDEWLAVNGKKLVEYNKQDVDVLEALTKQLLSVLENITGYTFDSVVRLPSISALSYKWWFSGVSDGDYSVSAVSNEGFDKIVVRSGLVAGRTEGVIGYHEFPKYVVLIDAVSLYPTAMLRHLYPVGKERALSTLAEWEEAWNNNLLGLYYVEWDQSTMKTPHPILPARRKDGRLDWKSFGSGKGYLPSVTIKQLINYGATVKNAIPEELVPVEVTKKFKEGDSAIEEFLGRGSKNMIIEKDGTVTVTVWEDKVVTAIVWDKSAMVFEKYVQVLSKLKNEQDEYSRKKDSRYNPALREMVKMMLNAISGKVLQRNFDNHYAFCKGVDEVFKKIVGLFGELTEEEIDEFVSEGSEQSARSSKLKKIVEDYALDVEHVATDVSGNEYGNLLWKMSSFDPKHSKPSQLGIFIYAHAREYMFDNVFSKMRVWYSDTDSALISVADYDNLIDSKLKCNDIDRNWNLVNKHDKVFGDYEIESADNGVFRFDAVSVVAPKTYALWSKGKVVKYRCKGIRKSDSFENAHGRVLKIEEHKEEFFELLVSRIGSGEKTKVHTWSFGRKWGKGLGVDYNEIVKEI